MIWPFRSKRDALAAPTERTVDDRTFLLGLDRLYREAMKRHERAELREAAERLLAALSVAPSSAPVEGYYTEDAALTAYFLAFRALQDVPVARLSDAKRHPEYDRLLALASSPMFGRPHWADGILPRGRDPLTIALLDPKEPELTRVVARAGAIAEENDDISLVGIAARLRDAVVLTAVRESVVLYAEVALRGMPPRNTFVWAVSEPLAELGRRFIAEYETLFPVDAGTAIAAPGPASAEAYWNAASNNVVAGRCVLVAKDDTKMAPFYHFAIRPRADALDVEAFWARELWTTARYRKKLEQEAAGLEPPLPG